MTSHQPSHQPLHLPARRRARRTAMRSCVSLLGLVIGSSLLAGSARAQDAAPAALPQGGRVVLGQAQIGGGQIAGGSQTMTIAQAGTAAVIDWRSFDIGAGNRVSFVQPDARAVTLNLVSGDTASTLAGSLTATGSVVLLNPNGIAITATGSVDVGSGFAASTLALSGIDERGRLSFRGNGRSAPVTHAGTITVGAQGFAALVGGSVASSGVVTVPMGRITVAAGETATIDTFGDGFLQIALGDPGSALASHGGALLQLPGSAARAAWREVVALTSDLSAGSVRREGNAVVFGAEPEPGTVALSGRLDVSSPAAPGGAITVAGQAVALTGAMLDASGTRGGAIAVGGGALGEAVAGLAAARSARLDAGTLLQASGTAGQGGTVTVWGGETLDYQGRIVATGTGGDGGSAEVSGMGAYVYGGTTNLLSEGGRTGTLLLDPGTIVICRSGDAGCAGAVSLAAVQADASTTSTAYLQDTTLASALTSASVALAASVQITDSSSAVSVTTASGGSLSLTAPNITLAGSYGVAGGLTVNNTDGTSSVTGVISGPGGLTKAGAGTLTLSGANTYTGTTALEGGMVRISADANLGAAPASFTANALTFNGGGLATTGAMTLNANRGITLNTAGSFSSGSTVNYGGRITGAGQTLTVGGSDLVLLNTTGTASSANFDVTGGRLFFNSANAIGSGTVQVRNAATLVFNGAGSTTIGNAITLLSGGGLSSRATGTTFTGVTLPTAGGVLFNFDDQPTGAMTVTASTALTGNLAVQVGGQNASVGATTLTGVLSGSGSLTKNSTGNLTLTAANTYTGSTTISGGTLQVTGSGTMGGGTYSGGLTTASGASFVYASSANQVFSNLAGGGTNTFSGSGTVTLSGTQSFTGTYNINQTATISGGANAAVSGLGHAAAINLGGYVTLAGADNSLVGFSPGSQVLTINAGGTLYNPGTTTFHLPALVMAGGNLASAATSTGNALTYGTYSFDKGVSATANSTLSASDMLLVGAFNIAPGVTLSVPGTFVHNAYDLYNLTMSGGGTMILSGANTYTGTTTISAGKLKVLNASTTSNAGTLGTGNVAIAAGAVLEIANSSALVDTYNVSNLLTGAGRVLFSGPDGSTTLLSGANTYSGGTTVQSGVVNINQSGAGFVTSAFGTGTITMTGGALRAANGEKIIPNAMVLSGTLGFGLLTSLSGSITLAGDTTITPSSNFGSSSWSGPVALGGYTLSTAGSGPNGLGADWTGSTELVITGPISGTGGINHGASGILTLAGANTYTGPTTISAGKLKVLNASTTSNAGTLGTGNVAIAAGAVLEIANSRAQNDAYNVNNVLTGAGSVLFSGPDGSITTLGGANSYTGGTAIQSGVINVNQSSGGVSQVFGTGTITMTGGAIRATNSGKSMANPLQLSGTVGFGFATSFTGPVTLLGATTITPSANFGGSTWSGPLALGGFTLATANTGPNALGSSAWLGATALNLSGAITGTGGITHAASGTLQLSGANTYTGSTTISAGTVQARSTTALGSNSALSVASGAVLDLAGVSSTVGSLAGAGTVTNSSATAATLTNGGLNAATTFSGVLQNGAGTLRLTQTGTGTLTLSGTNTYTGNTTINGGTLALASSGALTLTSPISGAGALTINAGAGSAITADNSVAVGSFTLTQGAWSQLNGTLPGFSAGTFTVGSGATFLRATGGTGAALTPYTIADVYGLQGIGTSATYLGNAWQLAGTIDASGTSGWNAGAGFAPIGTSGASFTGTLDGNGNSITGLTISRAGSSNIGLIGHSTNATVRNLTLSGFAVTGSGTVGGVAGRAGGVTASNLFVQGTVNGNGTAVGGIFGSMSGNLTSAFANVAVTNASTTTGQTGGAAGYAGGATLSQVATTGTVDSAYNWTGGLAGWTEGVTIADSYSTARMMTGASIGGLVGPVVNGTTRITNSYFAGTVKSGSGAVLNAVGGGGTWSASSSGIYVDTTVSGTSNTGSLTGITGLATPAMQTQATFTGWDFSSIWLAPAPGQYPLLRSLTNVVSGAGNLTISNAAATATNVNVAALLASLSIKPTLVESTGGTVTVVDPVSAPTGSGLFVAGANGVSLDSSLAVSSSLGVVSLRSSAGALSGSGTIAAGRQVNLVAGTGSGTLSGAISGTADLRVLGAGTVVLTGANTYTGTTTVSGGTLQIGSGGTTGTLGTGSIANTAALVFNRSDALTVGNAISGTGSLTQAGTGTLTLSGANTYTGLTTVSGGQLTASLSQTQNAIGTGAASVAAGGILQFNNLSTASGFVTANNTVSGTGRVNLNFAAGTTARNTILGGLAGFSGQLALSTPGATGDKLYLTTGMAGSITVGSGTTLFTPTGGSIGGITASGTGNSENLGAIRVDTGTLASSITLAGDTTLGVNGAGSSVISGTVSGAFTVTKAGSGTLSLSGANTYSGATRVNTGTLAAGSTTAFGSNSAANVSAGATLDLAGNSLALGSLAGAGTVTNGSATAATLTTGGLNASTTFTGVLKDGAGVLSVTQTGSGRLSLSGANTFTGPLQINYGVNCPCAYSVDLLAGGSLATNSIVLGTSGTTSGNAVIAFEANNQATNAVITMVGGTGGVGSFNAPVVILNSTTQSFVGLVGSSAGEVEARDNFGPFNGTLILTGSGTYDFAGSIVNSAYASATNTVNLIKQGTGTQILRTNTYTGTTTINAGTLQIGNGSTGSLTGTSGISIASGATLALGLSSGATVASPISGAGALTKLGTGTTILTGANSYTGTTTISAGTLQVGAGGTAGTIGSGAVANAGTLAFNRSDAITVGNAISGTGALSKSGAGTLTLTGANSYTGATTVNAGTLSAGSASALGNNSATTIGTGSTLDLAGQALTIGSLAGAGTITNSAASAVILSNGGLNTATTFSGSIQDGIGGVGLTQGGTSSTLSLSGASTFTGALQINQGATVNLLAGASLATGVVNIGKAGASSGYAILTNAANNQLGNAVVTFNGASGKWAYWQLNNTAQSVLGVNDASGNGVLETTENASNATATLTLTGSGSYGFNGYLRSTSGGSNVVLNLVKSGSGTQQFSGAQIRHTGNTTIGAGTLRLLDTTAFVSAATVNAGATLSLGRSVNGIANRARITGTISGAGTLGIDNPTSGIGGGWVNFANGAGLAAGFTGNVAVNSGVLTMDNLNGLWAATPAVSIASGGLLALRGQSLTVSSLTGTGDVFNSWNGNAAQTLTVTNPAASTFDGVIHGSIASGGSDGAIEQGVVNLVKAGAGTLTLTGANTYSGTTTVNAGTLALGGTGSLGTGNYAGAVTLGGGNLTFNTATAQRLSGTLTLGANATVTNSAASLLTLSGNVGLGSRTLTLLGNGTATGDGTAYGGATANMLVSGVISGSGGLQVGNTTAANLTLSGANTFTGNVTLGCAGCNTSPASVLTLTNSAALGAGPKVVSAQSGGEIHLQNAIRLPGTISLALSGSVFQNGANTTNGVITSDSGDNVIDGAITIAGGAGLSSFQAAAGSSLTLNGAIAANTSNRSINLDGAGTITVNGAISDGTHPLALVVGSFSRSATGTMTLTGANTYTGATTVSGGTLVIGGSGSLGAGDYAGGITLSGGNLTFNTTTAQQLTGPLALTSHATLTNSAASLLAIRGNVSLGSRTLTLLGDGTPQGGSTANMLIAGAISGSGGLQVGSTTTATNLTLAGANSYTGTTTVNGGTLTLDGSWAPANGLASTVVSSGATLTGSGTITAGTLAHSGGGMLSLTGANAIGRLQTSGTLGALRLNAAQALATGSIDATGEIALTTTPGSGASLTLDPGAVLSSAATGTAITLAADQAFINSAGAGALAAPNGRWLVYAATPGGSQFGGLDSGNRAVWATANGAPVTAAGNRYAFAYRPTVTFTVADLGKTYGTDVESDLAASLTLSGIEAGTTGAYLADTPADAYAGTPQVTSAGAAATAAVAGGPYAITLAPGTVAALNGYALAWGAPAWLTVNRAPLTITGASTVTTYNGAAQTNTYAITAGRLFGNDTLTGLAGLASATNAGAYADALTGASGSGLANYAINYVNGGLTIDRAPLTLTYTADRLSSLYGAPLAALSGRVSGLGFAAGEGLANLRGAATWTTDAPSASGSFGIRGAGLTSLNYAITAMQDPGNASAYRIDPAPLRIAVNDASVLYGGVAWSGGNGLSIDGLVNGDTAASLLGSPVWGGSAQGAVAIGRYDLTAGGLANPNYAISWIPGTLSILPPSQLDLTPIAVAQRSAAVLDGLAPPAPAPEPAPAPGAGAGPATATQTCDASPLDLARQSCVSAARGHR